ncbi:MAG: DinB family protein, partial [Bacteroidota bacterium]
LIEGEKNDWLPRIELILSETLNKEIEPFDRFSNLHLYSQKVDGLLKEFNHLRQENLDKLKSYNLGESELSKTGIHPELGKVSLKQLLATWTVHDLSHIAQIVRVLSKQYEREVGPWINYLGILNR